LAISAAMKTHIEGSATYLAHLVRIEERPREIPIHWASAARVNVLARGGKLKATTAAGAGFSTQGLVGDGYLRFTVRSNGTVYCGLSTSNGGATEATIQHAIRVDANGTIRVYESNVLKATAATTARSGDWFYVKRAATTNAITYHHNRSLIYTSALTPSAALFADAAITTSGATIEQAVFGTSPAVILATDHTRKLTFNSETYTPRVLLPTRFSRSDGLKPDNAELIHILQAGGVTETELRAGRWDYARWEFMTVNYLDLSMGVAQHAKGRFGEFRIDNGRFVAELRALSQPLSQPLGQIVSSLCDARQLGDDRCGQPLDNYMHDADVTTSSGLTITVNLSPAKADGYFQYGLFRFRSGNNRFYEREIKNNAGNVITLQRPFPLTITAGDDVTLIAGCVRTIEACKTFVNPDNPSGTNVENFQGSPFSPGSSVYRFPE